MIKTEKQSLNSIHCRIKTKNGVDYKSFVSYVGTDPATHHKIIFERATKDECVKAVRLFYASRDSGAPIRMARELTPSDMADIKLARGELLKAGIPSISFLDITRDYIARHATVDSTLLPEALRRYIATYSNLQVNQIKSVQTRVGRFVEAHRNAFVTDIRPSDVTAYMTKNYGNKSPKTFNENLSYIKSFFNWCRRKDIRLCIENPCEDIRKKPIHYEEPEFVDAGVVRTLFDILERRPDSETNRQIIWFFAIWFFMGVRTEEIMRIRHKDVNLEDGWIRIAFPKGFQHGVAPRMVEMPEVCKRWLRTYGCSPDGSDNKLITRFAHPQYARMYLMKAAIAAGEKTFSLPDNAGRHSFVTMHVALHGEPSRTEAQAGTGRDMRVKNYMGLATRMQARDYFDVMPDKMEEMK